VFPRKHQSELVAGLAAISATSRWVGAQLGDERRIGLSGSDVGGVLPGADAGRAPGGVWAGHRLPRLTGGFVPVDSQDVLSALSTRLGGWPLGNAIHARICRRSWKCSRPRAGVSMIRRATTGCAVLADHTCVGSIW